VPGTRKADESREQQELLPGIVRARVRPTRKTAAAAAEPVADVDPVARVLVDVPLAHLDRTFDYGVPRNTSRTTYKSTSDFLSGFSVVVGAGGQRAALLRSA